MALPALTIHSIVYSSNIILKNIFIGNRYRKLVKYGPSIIGLSSIPFIIQPLDHLTDWIMDRTLRNLYGSKLQMKNKKVSYRRHRDFDFSYDL